MAERKEFVYFVAPNEDLAPMTAVPEDEIAYHEAGHAVVSAVLGSVPETVTIVPSGSAAGYSGSSTGIGSPGVLQQMVVSYAGYAAHIQYSPQAKERAAHGARDDFEKAKRCTRVLPLNLATGEPALLEKHQMNLAKKLVKKHWRAVRVVAQSLITKKTIHADELTMLIAAAAGHSPDSPG